MADARTTAETLELYRRGWDEEDFGPIEAAITDDFELLDPWGTLVGKEKMRRYCEASYRRFRDITTVYTAIVEQDGVVGVEWTMSLTGDLPDIDGKVADLVGGAIVRMRGDRIASWHDYWDSAQMSRALGLPTALDLKG